jgi:hypothetical protein
MKLHCLSLEEASFADYNAGATRSDFKTPYSESFMDVSNPLEQSYLQEGRAFI